MWFGMIIILFASVVYSYRYLRGFKIEHSIKASAYAKVGVLYGILGLLTGAMWARYTWGDFWSGDLRQNTAAIAVLIYLAYFVLRA